MKLAIMQPYFFPYIGYFQLIRAVDKYIIYDNLNFIKDAWINRNRIPVKNSGITLISVPLKSKSSFQKIRDTCIDNSQKWKDKLKKTIILNYQKSPMFEEVFPVIDKIIDYDTDKIAEFNFNLIRSISKYIGTKTMIETDSGKYMHIEDILGDNQLLSLRYPDTDLRTIRILEICKQENADKFYNAIGGMELYSKDIFGSHNIELKFLKTSDLEYKQFKDSFIPHMSIIDVLMFNTVGQINNLMDKFELI